MNEVTPLAQTIFWGSAALYLVGMFYWANVIYPVRRRAWFENRYRIEILTDFEPKCRIWQVKDWSEYVAFAGVPDTVFPLGFEVVADGATGMQINEAQAIGNYFLDSAEHTVRYLLSGRIVSKSQFEFVLAHQR